MIELPIVLRVIGTPMPQGSKTAFVRHGKAVVVEGRTAKSRKAFEDWRQAAATAARDYQEEHLVPLLEGPLDLSVVFLLDRPKSKPKWKLFPDVAPDLDKICRSLGDSLSGILYKNDAQICHWDVWKRYALDEPPGAVIRLDLLQEGPEARTLTEAVSEQQRQMAWIAGVERR